ncbi:MAG: hypothetical protein U0L56_06790 [Lachnospiraceae bacterium]|nr:hypothetical protein [Lachnospiraceae bacterium]
MMEETKEKLQDVLSIISLLKSDMDMQKAEEVHQRAVRLLYKMVSEIYLEINSKN